MRKHSIEYNTLLIQSWISYKFPNSTDVFKAQLGKKFDYIKHSVKYLEVEVKSDYTFSERKAFKSEIISYLKRKKPNRAFVLDEPIDPETVLLLGEDLIRLEEKYQYRLKRIFKIMEDNFDEDSLGLKISESTYDKMFEGDKDLLKKVKSIFVFKDGEWAWSDEKILFPNTKFSGKKDPALVVANYMSGTKFTSFTNAEILNIVDNVYLNTTLAEAHQHMSKMLKEYANKMIEEIHQERLRREQEQRDQELIKEIKKATYQRIGWSILGAIDKFADTRAQDDRDWFEQKKLRDRERWSNEYL